MEKSKLYLGLAVVAVVLSVISLGVSMSKYNAPASIGAAGTLLAENYNSYIMQNNGYYSAKPIQTTGTLDVAGTATFTGAAVFSGAVTGIATSSLTTLTVSGATNLAIATATRINIVNGTATSSISIGNTGVGNICQWNGANYTITNFASNSVTPVIATSSSCN